MDNVANEPHEQPQDLVTKDVGGDSQDFSSRPQDTSVRRRIMLIMWHQKCGQER